MTFEEWTVKAFEPYKDQIDYESQIHIIGTGNLRNAWNAAIHESQLIAWEYARGLRQRSLAFSRSDDIAEDIRKLEDQQ